ncbi:MAG TPA: alpha/beta hydrolase [Roseiarcus sp.]|nr:alpha/beta hydrolase [Roseiarcus sp.]
MDVGNNQHRLATALVTLRRIRDRRPRLEVLSRPPVTSRNAPPLLFVHGAWHGAWCWDEHFLGYFSQRGFWAHAVSLRGHGESEGKERLRFARLRDFVEDLEQTVDSLPATPVLIGHSLGGLVVQKYLERRRVPLAVLLASVPPKGAWRVALRRLREQPVDVLKSNLTVSLWPLVSDPETAWRSLFSPQMPRSESAKHHARLQDEAVLAYLDSLLFNPVSTRLVSVPIVVMGAERDRMIGRAEVEITARAYGVEPIIARDCAHDMMLDLGWREVADRIAREFEIRFPASSDRVRVAAARRARLSGDQ